MIHTTLRKLVKIDEEKCNGCGICISACAEGALQIIEGKARLISDKYCDGLGACLSECPQGAITIEERVAEKFDEGAVTHHLAEIRQAGEEPLFQCPSAVVTSFDHQKTDEITQERAIHQPSMLSQWPIQLALVPPQASFLRGAELVLAADCVPFAYANFHRDFLRDHCLLVACPKLDNFQAHLQKLTAILSYSSLKSLTVVHMEVPCCFGLVHLAKQAIQLSGQDIPFKTVTISVRGELKV